MCCISLTLELSRDDGHRERGICNASTRATNQSVSQVILVIQVIVVILWLKPPNADMESIKWASSNSVCRCVNQRLEFRDSGSPPSTLIFTGATCCMCYAATRSHVTPDPHFLRALCVCLNVCVPQTREEGEDENRTAGIEETPGQNI